MLLLCLAALSCLPSLSLAEEQEINEGWRSHIDPASRGFVQGWAREDFSDSAWTMLQAGKSWAAQGYFNYSGTAWYRKRIALSSKFRGKFLIFYGANDRCTVFFDGVKVADHGPTSNPKLRGFFTSSPPFRLRLPDRRTVLVAIRMEGSDTHRIYAPGPGLAGSVALSDEVLMKFQSYWLAPDQLVTRAEWLQGQARRADPASHRTPSRRSPLQRSVRLEHGRLCPRLHLCL